MSQVPPPSYQPPTGSPQPVNYSMQPSGSNGWAIASLVTGVAGFCLPFIGGLLAIVFGFLGLGKAKRVGTGKGLSIAGMAIGAVSLITSFLFIGSMLAMVGLVTKATQGPRDGVAAFIKAVSAGDVAAAQAQTDGSVKTEEIEGLRNHVKDWGTCTDVTTTSTSIVNNRATVSGKATFSTAGEKTYSGALVNQGGSWKVSSFQFD